MATWTQYMVDPSGQQRTFRGLSEQEAMQQAIALQGQGWRMMQRTQEAPNEVGTYYNAPKLAQALATPQSTPVTVINPDGSQSVLHTPEQLNAAIAAGSMPTNEQMTGFSQVATDAQGNYTINGQTPSQALSLPQAAGMQNIYGETIPAGGNPMLPAYMQPRQMAQPGVTVSGQYEGTLLDANGNPVEPPPGPGGQPGQVGGPVPSGTPQPTVTPSEPPGSYQQGTQTTVQAPGGGATTPGGQTINTTPNYTGTPLPAATAATGVPSNFNDLLNYLQSQIQGRMARSDAVTSGAYDLANRLAANFGTTQSERDRLVSEMLYGTGGQPGVQKALSDAMARANEGLTPEALSALRSQATSTIPTQYNTAAEQLRTQLLNRGVTGGTQPTAAGPFINRMGSLMAARDAAVAQANQNTILANEQMRQQNRANALTAAGQGTSLIGQLGNIYNPAPYAQGALSGFNAATSAQEATNQLLGLGTQLAGVQGQAQPGSTRSILLSSLLATGGQALLNYLKGLGSSNPNDHLNSFNINFNPTIGVGGGGSNGPVYALNDPMGLGSYDPFGTGSGDWWAGSGLETG